MHRQAASSRFCANPSACRDASTTTALVLEARASEEVDGLPRTLLMRIVDTLRDYTESAAIAEADGNDADTADTRHEQDDMDELYEAHEHSADEEALVRRNSQPHLPATDCPLTCSVASINNTMPAALIELRKTGQLFSALKLRRIWTTMCCISVLERLTVCWVWGDGDLYAPVERCVYMLCVHFPSLMRLHLCTAQLWMLHVSGSRRRQQIGPCLQPRWKTAQS